MEDFRTVATVLSMLLGLGVTRLILGVVTVFRTRRTSPVDWLPLGWAAVCFAMMLQFWWAISALPQLKNSYTFADFLFLVTLTLMLFLAGALLVPSRSEDETRGLRAFFEEDGRYGLLALSAFLLLGLLTNIFYFNSSPLSAWGLLDMPMIAIPCAAFFARSRAVQMGLLAVYVPTMVLDFFVS